MEILKKFMILWLICCVFLSILFLYFSVVRFFDGENFEKFTDIYGEYALFDADTSLVFEGEQD